MLNTLFKMTFIFSSSDFLTHCLHYFPIYLLCKFASKTLEENSDNTLMFIIAL